MSEMALGPSSSGPDRPDSDAVLGAIARASRDPIIVWTLDGTITFWNAAAERLYDYTADEMLGQDVHLLVPDEHRAVFNELQEQVHGGLRVRAAPSSRRRRDGSTVPMVVSISAVLDEHHRPVGFCTIAHDVTDDEERLHELRESQQEAAEALSTLATLQQLAPVGIGYVDRDFTVVHLNAMLASINGSPPEEQIGRSLEEVAPEVWSQVEPVLRQVLGEGHPVLNQEVSAVNAALGGIVVRGLANFYPVQIDGEVIGVGVVVVDVTDLFITQRTPRGTLSGCDTSA